VAGLALISTWVAGEIGYIEAGFQNLGPGTESVDGFGVFVATIPYRFYVLWALLFVPFAALLGRDFGPMLAAERRQLASGKPSGDARPAASEPEDSTPKRWINAVLPIFVMLGVTLALLLSTGARKLGVELSTHLPWRTVAVVFGNGNSYLSLVYGSLAGLFSALLLVRVQRLLTGPQMRAAAFEGAKSVIPALTILWLAWALSGITDEKHLGTGNYLGERLQQMMDVRWMPTLVFVLSSLVAFATGTSWGTMGILMPIVIGATYRMVESQTGAVSPDSPLLVASIGGVLAGAIFGDHCSPISDTTVLSAQASGCNLMAHVGTQLPYALVIALVSVVCGTLPVGFGCSVWPLMLLGPCAMILLLLVLGRPVEPTADRQ
jgi:Na+/H+ antiporter NhaC